MLYCDIMLTREYPEKAADKPTAGVPRVQCQRAVDQPNHRADVLAEGSQHLRGVGEYTWVVLSHFERLASQFDGLTTGCLHILRPAVSDERHMTDRRPDKSRSIMPIDCYRPFE